MVYSRRPKAPKSVSSSSKSKIIESRISNQSEPTQTRHSTISNVPSSFFIDCRLYKLFCGIWTPDAPSISPETALSSPISSIDFLVPSNLVKFLRSKDEAPEFLIKFLKMIQVRLNATVRNIRTDNGTKFGNQTLRSYYEDVVEAARTMLIYVNAPLFLWAEAVATIWYTQNRSLIRLHHRKTPYELLHDRKPDLSYLYVFGALSNPTNNSEDLGKLKAKADVGIFVGYAPAKKAYRIYNQRTRRIIETIYADFDELTAMAPHLMK
ncbi:retrovirus-related pol polyprotein from transposon TNT 1-94 [Tanacetum coccineum]